MNKDKLHTWSVKSGGEYTCFIPKEYLSNSPVEIRFELPDADSPARLRPDSRDNRMLGLMVKSVKLAEI